MALYAAKNDFDVLSVLIEFESQVLRDRPSGNIFSSFPGFLPGLAFH